MALLPIRQIVAVALAVVMTVSMSLIVGHVNDISAAMTISTAMEAAGNDSGQNCANENVGGMKAMPCAAAAACFATACATLPQAGPAAPAGAAAILSLPEDDLLLGSIARPDPYPPRSSNIG